MTSLPPPTGDTILFRPGKKRKIYRQRPDEALPEPQPTSPGTSPAPAQANPQSIDELIASTSANLPSGSAGEGDELEGTPVSISEILRLRKKNKRIGGVEFRAEGHISRDEDGALVIRHALGEAGAQSTESESGPVIRKFTPQTGTVGDVNKHMMAYIDSELAKRRVEGVNVLQSSLHQSSGFSGDGLGGFEGQDVGIGTGKKETEVQRQPAALGKLLEIDLGDEARSKNVMRTEQARRKLDGEEVEDEVKPGKPGKVRLGRDGKPWRGRKRRGSDDVKRDKLVEEVLRENRLEIYEEPVVESQAINDDQAADDRIAEAFRKEFMDAVSARQRKKTAPAQPPARTAGGKKEEEVLKGPKLGGSRSARAAMRETMLKNAKK
ncbi:hypothetical protein L207DRAFT_529742 [Hyaloscypha variabilis F]|uniref:Uncharacterized protein n=1 Tax=Hyaloscypha variabilis (strain UAMH 11265 / GT02V1 / F) TaxID=1149755 RepID=A0A2J6RMS6_HYAVF|nr:hypothetical protein L207DRAFT_529742 [Hyaloscypha variabilis F]